MRVTGMLYLRAWSRTASMTPGLILGAVPPRSSTQILIASTFWVARLSTSRRASSGLFV